MGKKNKRLTTTEINERLRDRGIELIGDYESCQIKTTFKCRCGYEWYSKPGNILIGNTGCPVCSRKRIGDSNRSTKEIVNERIKHRGIELIGDYVSKEIKTDFKHICGHVWAAKPGNILYGKGCPACSESGFNANKPAWSYILDFGHFMKYGITNNLESRMYAHKAANGTFIIVKIKYHELGIDALGWERSVKTTFGGRYVTKEQCRDGWTETLSSTLLSELVKTMT